MLHADNKKSSIFAEFIAALIRGFAMQLGLLSAETFS